MAILEMKHISKAFSGVYANEDIDLSVEKGEIHALLGENGAGKTTLMNIVGCLDQATSGQLFLDGQDITRLPEHKRAKQIGRVFQDPLKGTAFDMTIEENLSIAYNKNRSRGLQWGISRKDRELFREKLRLLDMGLEDRMKEKARLLSGGQRQALTLLMATLVTPKLLLLDEHTAALDPATAEKVLALTKKIVAENHITCLMITHNIPSALSLGNRTIMMDAGRIVLDLAGEERAGMTVDALLEKFRTSAGKELDNDRILLSDRE